MVAAAGASIGGSLLGGLIGGGKKPDIPDYVPVIAGDVQAETARDNLAVLGDAAELGRETNLAHARANMAVLDEYLPGQFDAARANTGSLLAGEIPGDVAAQVIQSGAARSFAGGFQGSGIGRNLTARDLGLTSLNLQQGGFNQFQALSQIVNPNPFNISSMFFSPQERLRHAQLERDTKFQRDLLHEGIKAQPSPVQAALGSAISGFGNALGGSLMNQWGFGNTFGKVLGGGNQTQSPAQQVVAAAQNFNTGGASYGGGAYGVNPFISPANNQYGNPANQNVFGGAGAATSFGVPPYLQFPRTSNPLELPVINWNF